MLTIEMTDSRNRFLQNLLIDDIVQLKKSLRDFMQRVFAAKKAANSTLTGFRFNLKLICAESAFLTMKLNQKEAIYL